MICGLPRALRPVGDSKDFSCCSRARTTEWRCRPDHPLPIRIMRNCTSSLHRSPPSTQPEARSDAARSARKDLQRRALRIVELDISFVRNRAFARMKPEAATFPKEPLLVDEEGAPFRRTRLSPLFRTPLLRPEGERTLFRRMNFCRYRALRLRSQLNPHRPAKRLVEEIETLLRNAELCRSQLVESNLRLVAAIARGFRTSVLDVEELVSEGNVVLLNAVDKFDFSRGFRFSTYATHAVRRHLYRRILRDQKRTRREQGVDSDLLNETAAARAGVDDRPGVQIPFEDLRDWIGQLDPRHRAIVMARYGLDGERPQTLKELTGSIGLSKERIRQLQLHALDELHRSMPASVRCLAD